MLVFIDESGDAGFKAQKGSTTFFVITLSSFWKKLKKTILKLGPLLLIKILFTKHS